MLLLVLVSTTVTGCVSQSLLDAPLCPERDFVLQPVSVASQNSLRLADDSAFEVLATNDLILKSHIRMLETMIESHDEPLGGCD